MNLRYIALGLNREQFNDEYRYNFESHTRFISNFFSKSIRKIKFETDGTFDMISIAGATKAVETKIVPLNAISVDLKFDRERYEKLKGTGDSSLYLEMLEQGFIKAAKYKSIPLNELLGLIKGFKNGNCKNEWLHKRKKFKDIDIEIVLECEFTTNYFQLLVTLTQISTGKELVKGILLRTEPDELFFEGMFKDVCINHDIIVTDSSDEPRIIIKREAVLNGNLTFKIVGDEK